MPRLGWGVLPRSVPVCLGYAVGVLPRSVPVCLGNA